MGLAEVASLLGTSRQRASEIVRGADFPAGRQLKAGPVWQALEVRAWARTWKRRPGPAPAGSAGRALPRSNILSDRDIPPARGDLPELSGTDLETYRALLAVESIGPTLARLYIEAHQLAAGGTPIDPLALSAHDVRDILMKLHEAAATPGKSYIDVSKTAYHQLRDAWEQARESLSSFRPSDREVNAPIDRFISAVQRLLGVSEPLQPRKAKLVDDFLNRNDPARHLLPQAARHEQSLRWDEERKYFNAVGHHGPVTDVDTLRAHIETVNALVLTALRPQPFVKMAEMDAKIQKAESTSDETDIAGAVSCMTNGVEFDHFFQQIRSPIWLEYPASEQMVCLHLSPRSRGRRYRSRHGSLVNTSSTSPRTAHCRPRDLPCCCEEHQSESSVFRAQSVLAMPPHVARGFTKEAARWAGQRSTLTLVASALGDLAVHLARGGECKAALSIARPLLTLDPVPPSMVETAGQQITIPHDPTPRYEPYEYRKFVLESLPQIVQRCGLPFFTTLSRILADAIRARDPEGKPPRDRSRTWRPTIETSQDNLGLDAMDALVDGLRDAGARVIQDDPDAFQGVRTELERARWDCHTRILIHLARIHAAVQPGAAVQLLMDRDLLHDYAVNHERDLLAHDCFNHLSGEQRKTYLQWVDDGPDRDDLRRRHAVVGAPIDVDTYVATSVQSWQRDRLAPLAAHLPVKQRRQLEWLIEQRGAPVTKSHRIRWRFGEESPLSPGELASMTVPELLDYLIGWEPPRTPWAPTAAGLANQLQQLVKQDPSRFAASAESFICLDPVYRRAVVSGLRDATSVGNHFDWSGVFALAEAIVVESTAPTATDHLQIEAFQERGSWSRQEVGRLLQDGLRKTPDAIPADKSARLLRIVLRLLRDADPAADPQSGTSAADTPLQRGINGVRGNALDLSLDVMRWARSHDQGEC